MTKKLISLILTICMVVSLAPTILAAGASVTVSGGQGYVTTYHSSIWGEFYCNSTDANFVFEVYHGDVLQATATYNGDVVSHGYYGWYIPFSGGTVENWTTVWEDGYPNKNQQPTTIILYDNDEQINSSSIYLNGPDGFDAVAFWTSHIKPIYLYKGEGWETYCDMGYDSLDDAIASANDGDIITLIDDITVSNDVTLPEGVSINSRGRSITIANGANVALNGDGNYGPIAVENGAGLTIRDGTFVQDVSAWCADGFAMTALGDGSWSVSPQYTVTYTDGVEDAVIFENQVYPVTAGGNTPQFIGTPERRGYIFIGWSPDVEATVTGNITYTAMWEVDESYGLSNIILLMMLKRTFAITTETTEGGEITFDGDFATTDEGYAKVRFRKDITYTIKADDGYTISDVLVDGKSVGAVSEYTFENVGKKHTISVIFAEIE